MLAALVAVVGSALARFWPYLQPLYLAGACLAVALQASAIHHAFRRDRMWTDELLRYIAPELVVMLILMRIVSVFVVGGTDLTAYLQGWFYDPLSIFDAAFLVSSIVGGLVGWQMHSIMQNLLSLAPRTERALVPAADASQNYLVLGEERAEALRRIGGRFANGGILVLLALAIETANFQQFAGPGLSVSQLSGTAAVVYLICGFLLYSQARFSLLRTRWEAEQVQVAGNVAQRWWRGSWLLIVSVALLALLLPRSYGLGLLETFQIAIAGLLYVTALLGYGILWLISLLALIPSWILSLLISAGPTEIMPPPAPVFDPPPQPEQLTTVGEWQPRLVTAIIFWVCVVLLAGYALQLVFKRYPGLLKLLVWWEPLAQLLRKLGLLIEDGLNWVRNAAQIVGERLQPDATTFSAKQRRYMRRLAPAELVRYFYRSTLRAANTRGFSRPPSQTPYEYEANLRNQVPDTEQDLHTLTEAFIATEYGPRPTEQEAARQIARPWMRLQRVFRRKRAQDTTSEEPAE